MFVVSISIYSFKYMMLPEVVFCRNTCSAFVHEFSAYTLLVFNFFFRVVPWFIVFMCVPVFSCCLYAIAASKQILAVSRVMVAWQPIGISMGIYDMCHRYQSKFCSSALCYFILSFWKWCDYISNWFKDIWRRGNSLEHH